jgi:2-iminobutanoate/2-iminopropanoate deaminase
MMTLRRYKMKIKKIETHDAPKPIVPYSQGVIAGDYLYISGQIALDPSNGFIVGRGIKEQTEQSIKNISAILSESSLDLNDIVKVDIFLTDLNDFKIVNHVYGQMFVNEPKPARQVVEASKLPMGAKIEISAIAYRARR